jgi:hypothetical protein
LSAAAFDSNTVFVIEFLLGLVRRRTMRPGVKKGYGACPRQNMSKSPDRMTDRPETGAFCPIVRLV